MKELGYIQLTMTFYQEKDGRWIGTCIELGTSEYGNTFDEAENNLNEAVELHLNTLEELGERKRFFKENKIKILKDKDSVDVNIKGINPDVYIRPQVRHLEYV